MNSSVPASLTASMNGRPMFPTASARLPASRRISVTSEVTVVFPFVPVIAMTGTLASENASSISATILAWSATVKMGWEGGTPGERTTSPTRAASSASCALEGRRTSWTPSSVAAFSVTSLTSPSSTAITDWPRSRSARAAACPVTAKPSTSTSRIGALT